MKKLIILLFLFSTMCTIISTELYANDVVINKEMKSQIAQTVKSEVADNSAIEIKDSGYNAGSLVNVIFFNQEITTENGNYVPNSNKECISVVIDDAWAVASKKCVISKGEEISPSSGIADRVSSSNFRIVLNDILHKVPAYETKNLILLRAVNENGNPLFASIANADLAFAPTADLVKFVSYFLGGTFEVNRTKEKKAAHDDGHYGAWEDNFHPYYGVSRKTYEKKIKAVYRDPNTKNLMATISATLVSPRLIRAGDPLFYVNNGKKYLLGFARATNLWDNFDNTRTDRVILLTNSDKKEILSKIKSVDSEAAARIEKNIFVK